MRHMKRTQGRSRRAVQVLLLGMAVAGLAACDSLLDADVDYLLTDDALKGAGTAGTQVSSVQALFECGTSAFGWAALGWEDVFESIAGVASGVHVYRQDPITGTCDNTAQSGSWFDQIMGARALASNVEGSGVYDKIESGEFSLGTEGSRLQAIAATYVAASLLHFGQYYCEGALDGSAPMDPTDFLADAVTWVDRIPSHVAAAGGDFELPNDAATSTLDTAHGLKAQILYAQGNLSAAATEAAAVPDGFVAYVTREQGEQRRNKYTAAGGFSGMVGPVDWWVPASRVNPATGIDYANPVPFTGYIFLGFGPEGETLDASNLPVRWAQQARDASDDPVPLAGFTSADADTRVPHEKVPIQGPEPREVPTKYTSDDDDIPFVNWKEMRLIRALAVAGSDPSGAIDHINAVRAGDGVRQITGSYRSALENGTYTSTVREVVFEEARRVLFTEAGRFWAWKINNTDLAWFPRAQGQTPFQGYAYGGGVRLQFPNDEYDLNPNFQAIGGRDARGTLCASDEAPTIL